MPCGFDVDVSELAHLTEGCTGADISSICREAAISAIEVCCISSWVAETFVIFSAVIFICIFQ